MLVLSALVLLNVPVPPTGSTPSQVVPAASQAVDVIQHRDVSRLSSEPDEAPAASTGVIVVTAKAEPSAADPLARLNEQSYAATQAVDDAVIGPTARLYKHAVPRPIRDGLRNFFRNLREPMVAMNDLLQLHPGRSVRTLARFAVNSTVGGAGLLDVAKKRPFHLPRHPNSLADTLGYYGVKPGPYLFLPLIGPTTVRDLVGGGVDRLIMPISIGGPLKQPAYTASAGAVSRIDRRERASDRLAAIRVQSDPYAARRDAYLIDRQAEIDALHLRGAQSETAFAALDPLAPSH